jgi:hypothetical protein
MEGDLEDNAIGEWTGSEDLRTGAETTEDEVCNFSLPHCFHASSRIFGLTIYPITTPCFVLPPLSFYLPLPFVLSRRSHLGEHW